MSTLFDRVWEYSLNNPDGFTLNLENFKPVVLGVAVAYFATQNSFGKEGLKKVIVHAQHHDNVIGGWLNLHNKRYYFDSIKIFKKLNDAIEFAKENQQIAVFNLTTLEEIYL